MTPTPATPSQTIILLYLSRGEQPPTIPPVTRRELLRKRWIAHAGTRTASNGGERPTFEITEAGKQALATSQHLTEAQKRIDSAGKSRLWQGLT